MKKILLLIIAICLALPCMALEFAPIEPVYDEQIEMQLKDINLQIEKALAEGDYKLITELLETAYNSKKSGSPEIIKKYNDMFSAFAIQTNLAQFELTQEQKYAKKAYKWSKIAVKDETSQLYSIQANIFMASYKPNKKQMTKAFTLYRKRNLKQAMDFLPEYQKLYDNAIEIKKQKADSRKAKIRNIFYYTMVGVAAGAKGYSESYQKNQQMFTNTHRSTTCRTYGNTLYCDSY